MRTISLFIPVLLVLTFLGCRNDDSYKPTPQEQTGNEKIELALTTRIGTTVGEQLTKYVKSLNLLLFRENTDGNYVLFRSELLTKAQLEALTAGRDNAEAGFTELKVFTFESVPLANYQIVGVGNIADSTGEALPNVSLRNAEVGTEMSQVIAQVKNAEQSSRLFMGTTGIIAAGTTGDTPQVLRMYRKVSMFALTLEKIPNVVNQIAMQIENTYGAFDMKGSYVSGSGIIVFATNNYVQQVQDSITLTYVTLPTISGDSTAFEATFYLVNGPKQIVTLPKYILKPNTITKVTATIDTDQPGNTWKVDIGTVITVNVEWNVDQEPPITI